MRRGANTFPSHNRLPNPRFGCKTPSCPFLFQFAKKKDGEAHALTSHVKPRRPSVRRKTVRPAGNQHQVAHIAPVFRDNQQYQQHHNHQQPHPQYQQQQHRPQQQSYQPRNSNQTSTSYERKRVTFDPIPMTYEKLYPSLIERKLITPRDPPAIPANPQWWYKPELHCIYHSSAPGHDVENCYPLKTKVQDLVRCGILYFENVGPNVKKNPLPEHGKSVNMVQGCHGKYKVKYVSHIRQSLVEMHRLLCDYSHYEHDHDRCRVCSVNLRGCRQVRKDVQEMLHDGVIEILQNRNVDEDADEVNVISLVFRIPELVIIKYDGSKQKVSPALTIKPSGPVSYSTEKAIPYRYNTVAVENGKEVSLPSSSVVNIADVSGLTHSGRVFSALPKPQANVDSVERPIGNALSTPNPAPVVKPSSALITPTSVGPRGNMREDCDEMLKLIRRSEDNVVDQLLQTPSKISVLSLLLNSEPHREDLQKVLDVAYVDHDVTIEQFDSIVANITAWFSREKGKEKRLKEKGQRGRAREEEKLEANGIAGFTQDLVAEKTHSRSGTLDSGHTRMALGNTRMGWLENGGFGAAYAYGRGHYAYGLGQVGQYAYGHRQYAYGQICDFPELWLCSFWLFRLSDVLS
ncbi:hypothetical protein KIW84_034739 [Lathyrus oleraceus]|uniref:Uncharacterized protein n=1 Tax=Pisum sativum TaxID=3888 RepID=A0A9D5B5M2_PEA|nr:hypothetical protein KIW84_034739 [Pisum sativum]